jgi:hypothetical protein
MWIVAHSFARPVHSADDFQIPDITSAQAVLSLHRDHNPSQAHGGLDALCPENTIYKSHFFLCPLVQYVAYVHLTRKMGALSVLVHKLATWKREVRASVQQSQSVVSITFAEMKLGTLLLTSSRKVLAPEEGDSTFYRNVGIHVN